MIFVASFPPLKTLVDIMTRAINDVRNYDNDNHDHDDKASCKIFVANFQPLETLVNIMTGATKEGVASWTVATEKGKKVFF